MNKRNQTVKFLFTSVASLAVASFLSACGGGGGSSPTGTVPNNDDQIKPGDGVVRFTRIGIDVLPALTRTGDLGGATMSATGAQVNFTYEDPVNQDSQYNFTFNTGFPGGAYAPGGMLQSPFVSITQGSTNSSVYISAPAQTQQLQNVFWTRADDPYTFGFGNTGYLLNPNSITWPASSLVTYTGTAMEYILNDVLTETDVPGYALYTAPVIATVDYTAKTVSFSFSSNLSMKFDSEFSVMRNADVKNFSADFSVTGLDFSQSTLGYDKDQLIAVSPGNVSGIIDALGFFGSHAENLGGTVRIQNTNTEPQPGGTTRYIGFALTKQ